MIIYSFNDHEWSTLAIRTWGHLLNMLWSRAHLCLSCYIHSFGTWGKCHFHSENPDRNSVWELIMWLSSTPFWTTIMPGLKHQGSLPLGSQKYCLCLPRLLLHYFWQGQWLRKFYQILGLGKDEGRTYLTLCHKQLDKNLSNDLLHSRSCKVWVLRRWSSTWRALRLPFCLRRLLSGSDKWGETQAEPWSGGWESTKEH